MSTMPKKARCVEVRGQFYPYMLKDGRGRYIGQSGESIRLVVELGPKKHFSTTFLSKSYTEDHDDGNRMDHKVSFTPRDVARVVEAAVDNEGTVPEGFDLDLWSVAPSRGV